MRKIAGAFIAGAALCASMTVHAESYPSKVVRIVVPYPPGGTVDAVARTIAQRLSESMGQQFIVDNRPGASGTIGSTAVAKSPADGYTLLVQASTFVASPLLMGNVPYDVEKDFTAITNLGSVPLLVTAYPGIPAKNLKEFLAAIKADPKKYVFGTSAVGSASHLAEEAIKYEAKVDFAIIPYKGTSPALTDVMGGHISAMVDALPSTMPTSTRLYNDFGLSHGQATYVARVLADRELSSWRKSAQQERPSIERVKRERGIVAVTSACRRFTESIICEI